jgi:Xaa-Pro aminopeptidase
MHHCGVAALIISDPVNIRYATGARNMQVFTARNTPSRQLLLTDDRSILFEFTGCEHLADGLETIDEVRPAMTASYVAAGDGIAAREQAWASEMHSLVSDLVSDGRVTVGLERLNAGAALALASTGLTLVDAQQVLERARVVKSTEEIKCVRASVAMTEHAVGRLRDAIKPGITENELWATMHHAVIAGNGDYCETRLMSSGPRTNPWFQEASSRVIQANELVALDTDVVGCHGSTPISPARSTSAPTGPRPSSGNSIGWPPTGLPQHGHHRTGLDLRRLCHAGLEHPRALPCQPLLPVGPRDWHDR